MLEKSSMIRLTEDDWVQYNLGVVSERIKQEWGIESFSELKQLVEASQSKSNL
jgi:hypothetical protein